MRQVLCSRLIGRSEELETLRDALARTKEGHGGAVMVLGEAGVGKSRLTREIETSARQSGMQTLWGRSVEGSAGAYRPLTEAFLSRFRSTGPPDVPELAPFRPILGRLIPEWRQEVPPPVADDPTVMLGEAIVRLLRVVACGGGCLLVLEDMHWADADTLAVIEYMVDNLRGEPVLLVVTLRSSETSVALGLVHRIASRRAARVMTLPKLGQESTEIMAGVCLDAETCPEPLADLLTSYTEGLPFFIEELLAAWIDISALVRGPGGWEIAAELPPIAPRTFTDTVQRRLGVLGEETYRLLQAAALLGRHFDWTLLPDATGLKESAVLERLRGAIEVQLIAADVSSASSHHDTQSPPTTFAFRHALTQTAILSEMLPPERARLSTRLLSLVEHTHPGLPGEWCDLAARLALESGQIDRAAGLLLQSGRRALARVALSSAESALDRAHAICPRDTALSIDIQDALTEVLSLAGKWERVFEVGGRLLVALERSPAPPERRVEIHLRIARAALAAGQWNEVATHLGQARELSGVGSDQDIDLPARVDALAAHLAIERGKGEEAAAFARAALERAERAGLPQVACEALEVLGRCKRVGDLEGAEAAFERAKQIAEENGLTFWRIRALHELGTIDLFREARPDRLLEARTLAAGAGALATAAMLDVQIAACYDQRPDFEATLEAARRGETLARRLHLDLIAALCLAFQGAAHAKVGNRREMEVAIAGSLELAGSDPVIVACMWESRAFASIVEDNWTQALHDVGMAITAIEGMVANAPGPFYSLWALIRTVNNIDGAAACEAVHRAGVTVNPINRGYVGYAEAILLGRSGRAQEATALGARADADLAGLAWYHHCGRRLLAEAAINDGWGDPATWLREAATWFDGAGYEKLTSSCRSLLRRMGVPGAYTGRPHAGVPARFRTLGITHREMEVLSLVAESLSNKEIGQRLYLSPRTVEKHVASLMAKTNTHTRVQLAALTVANYAS